MVEGNRRITGEESIYNPRKLLTLGEFTSYPSRGSTRGFEHKAEFQKV